MALFALIALFISIAAFFYPTLSTDAWWHISSGREIVKAKAIPAQDSFYCSGNSKWYAHEWLFDAAIYLVYARLGERGVKYCFAFMFFAALMIILFTALRAARGSLSAAIPAALLACALLIPYAEERPQIATIISMAIFIFVCMEKPGKNNIIMFYLLIPLTVLWTNAHSSAIAGVYALSVSFAFQYLIAGAEDRKYILRHGLILVPLAFLSILMSPLGLKAVMYFGEGAWLKNYISEWQGIISKGGTGYLIYAVTLAASGLTGLVILGLKLAGKKTRPEAVRDLLVFVPFFAAVFITKKVIPLFVMALVPVIAAGYAAKPSKIWAAARSVVFAVLIALFLVDREIIIYPKNAMDFIKKAPGAGCVLTAFEWGGYAENELYPARKVFINGRLNAPEAVIREYSNIYNAAGEFLSFMKETAVDYYVLRHDSPLARYLSGKNIKPVYADKTCVVYYRP
jgi:hypothetical protein